MSKTLINIKRIYEKPSGEDGYRMLVDKLWPRGVKKEEAHIDEWNKEVPPSTDLRKWFDHKPENFEKFCKLYEKELALKKDELKRIKSIARKSGVTLLYGAKDPHINHAVVLLKVLQHLK
ncbi:MAG: DUF488 family protein [Bacteroidetes bacterium]|nr:DUF488 family protein [Bacteroidota bacterium]